MRTGERPLCRSATDGFGPFPVMQETGKRPFSALGAWPNHAPMSVGKLRTHRRSKKVPSTTN